MKSYFVLTALTLLLMTLLGFTDKPATPPPGTYTISVVEEDVPANVPAEARSNFMGKWKIQLSKENKYEISKDGTVLVQGRLASEDENLKMTDEDGPLACSQQPGLETGTYKWSYEEMKLTFIAVEDKCEGRRFILTLRSWHQE
jgi:hypothetical protein